nr:hypothetical protein [Sedimentibacter sp.]
MIYKMEQEISNERYLTYEQMNIIITFHKLWVKVGYWIRTYIRSTIFDTPDKKQVSNYLISLPNEFYTIFSMFYGSDIAQNLIDILLNFITSAMKVIEYKNYDESGLTSSSTIEWYQSADNLSSYLANINVYWDENQWKSLLYRYIKLKTDDISAIVNSNYEDDINLYNTIDNVIFLIGSYMARGIIASNLRNIPNQ